MSTPDASTRPRLLAEIRQLLHLALPIMVAQLANTAMGFIDTLMAGRFSANDLAIVALGSSVWIPTMLLMTGTLMVVPARVARLKGANDMAAMGPLVRQSLWLGALLGLLAAILLLNAHHALTWLAVDAALIPGTDAYLRAIAAGFPALALYQALRGFSDGINQSKAGMLCSVTGLLLNIPLNYLFIYGEWGFPALGGVGCGWASALVMWCMLGSLLLWIRHHKAFQACGLWAGFEPPQRHELLSLLKTGAPIGVAIFAEASIFCVIALLLGNLGVTVVAGHQIALNFSSLIFMIPYSLGMAATVRVGQALGRQAPEEAGVAAKAAVTLALLNAGLSALLIFGFSEQIARFYSTDTAVIALASQLLLYAALFQFPDAIQATTAGALRGHQDTQAIMLITLLAYWGVGLPIGYWLSAGYWPALGSGPAGFWIGLIVALSCAAVLLSVRLQRRTHRTIP